MRREAPRDGRGFNSFKGNPVSPELRCLHSTLGSRELPLAPAARCSPPFLGDPTLLEAPAGPYHRDTLVMQIGLNLTFPACCIHTLTLCPAGPAIPVRPASPVSP